MGRAFQLAVAVIVLVIVVVAAVAFFGGGQLGPLERRVASERLLPRQEVRSLRIDAAAGRLEITEGTVARAEVRKSWVGRRPRVTQSVNSDGVWTITARCRGMVFGSCNAHLDVTVPPGTRLSVDHRAGNVRIHDLQSPEIDVDVSAGNLVMEDIDVDRLRTKSRAGNTTIELDAPPDDLDATSSAGNLAIELPEGTYDIDADASAGNAKVRDIEDTDGASHHIKARSSAGNVTVRRSDD